MPACLGLTARQMDAWMMEGEGLRLTRELFKPLKAVNFPLGNTGGQMGGWFRKEVKRLGDLKGLKMRVDGLAADVLARLGVAPQQAALAELAGGRRTAERTAWRRWPARAPTMTASSG